MYLTNNVLRRELERIALVAARTDDDAKRLDHTEHPVLGRRNPPADAERHEQIFDLGPGRDAATATRCRWAVTPTDTSPRQQRLSTAEGNSTVILITGGLGFIGSHTTRALLDLGESCILVQRRAAEVPDDMVGEVGRRVFIERADITELVAAGAPAEQRHPGIAAHLRACGPCGTDFEALLAAITGQAP